MSALSPDKLAYSIPEAERATSVRRDTLYSLIREGRLPARKLGSRTLLLKSDLEALLASLPRLTLAA